MKSKKKLPGTLNSDLAEEVLTWSLSVTKEVLNRPGPRSLRNKQSMLLPQDVTSSSCRTRSLRYLHNSVFLSLPLSNVDPNKPPPPIRAIVHKGR